MPVYKRVKWRVRLRQRRVCVRASTNLRAYSLQLIAQLSSSGELKAPSAATVSAPRTVAPIPQPAAIHAPPVQQPSRTSNNVAIPGAPAASTSSATHRNGSVAATHTARDQDIDDSFLSAIDLEAIERSARKNTAIPHNNNVFSKSTGNDVDDDSFASLDLDSIVHSHQISKSRSTSATVTTTTTTTTTKARRMTFDSDVDGDAPLRANVRASEASTSATTFANMSLAELRSRRVDTSGETRGNEFAHSNANAGSSNCRVEEDVEHDRQRHRVTHGWWQCARERLPRACLEQQRCWRR
jgi:hypothetical protein